MDIAVLKFFNVTIASVPLDIFFTYICDFDIWRWPLFLVGIALLWKGGPKGRWFVTTAVVVALIIDPTIYRIFKPLIGRLRPCHNQALDWVRAVAGCGGRYGFPSSHAANVFGLTIVLAGFYRTVWYFALPIAVLVSIGRIYLGVHYPSDVLAGAAYGSAVAITVLALAGKTLGGRYRKYLKEKKKSE